MVFTGEVRIIFKKGPVGQLIKIVLNLPTQIINYVPKPF